MAWLGKFLRNFIYTTVGWYIFFFSELLPALPELPGFSSSPVSIKPAEKPLDEQLQDAQLAIDEAQATLTHMQNSKVSSALSDINSPTLQDLVSAAENVLRNAQRYLENLETLNHTKKNSEARQFLTKLGTDPGSIDIELVRERLYATQQALGSAQSEMKFLLDRIQESVSFLSKLDPTIRKFGHHPSGADNWKRELAKLQKRGVELLVLADLARKNTLALRIAVLKQEAAADKKLLQAEATAAIRPQQEDKAALNQLEKERTDINRCIQEAHKRAQSAQDTLKNTRESYLKLRAAGVSDSKVTVARQQYELAQMDIETVEEIIEGGRSYLHVLDTEAAYWKSFAKLGDKISTAVAQKEVFALKPKLELIHKWQSHLEQEGRSKQRAIEGIKRHIDERKLKDTDREFLTRKLKLFHEQNEMQQRLLWRVDMFQWRLSDWLHRLQQVSPSPLPMSFKKMWNALQTTIAGTFNYEVLHSKETKMVGGTQVVVEEHSVTMGHIIIALTLFLSGYSILGKVARSSVGAAQIRFQLPAARIALLEKLVLYPMIVLLALCVLSWMRIPLTVFAYLGGALAIGVGFGAQNLINNFISGIILLFERQVNVGDIVEVDTHTGAITALGSRCSRMRRGDGVEVLIPNSLLLEKNVVNWTLTEPNHRFDFTFTVAYGSAIEQVIQLVTQALEETPYLLKHPPYCVFFEQFGSDGLVFGVYYWVKFGIEVDPRQPGSSLRFRIDQLFRKAGIRMPFAQRDVHLDSTEPISIRVERNVASE